MGVLKITYMFYN